MVLASRRSCNCCLLLLSTNGAAGCWRLLSLLPATRISPGWRLLFLLLVPLILLLLLLLPRMHSIHRLHSSQCSQSNGRGSISNAAANKDVVGKCVQGTPRELVFIGMGGLEACDLGVRRVPLCGKSIMPLAKGPGTVRNVEAPSHVCANPDNVAHMPSSD